MPTEDDQLTTPEGLRRAYNSSKEVAQSEKQRADQLARENLFLRAGINTDTTAGKLLLAGYHGDDLDELKSMAIEVGALKAPTPPPAQEQQQQTNQQPTITTQNGLPDDWEERAEMQSLARSGQSHGGTEVQTPHPMDTAMEGYFTDMRSGMDPDEARQKAMGSYLTAAAKGDVRTRFDARAHQQKAVEAER